MCPGGVPRFTTRTFSSLTPSLQMKEEKTKQLRRAHVCFAPLSACRRIRRNICQITRLLNAEQKSVSAEVATSVCDAHMHEFN